MKKFLLLIALAFSVASCKGNDNVYKNTVLDYLQTEDGIKTDFKIEFSKFEVSDITVADSVRILQSQYIAEKQKKVESAQQSVVHWKDAIEKQKAKGDNLVAQTLIARYKTDLEKAQAELQAANDWVAGYLDRYDGRSSSEILAKQVDTSFSFQNPKLTVRQEMGAIFVLSPDGTQCYNMIKDK
ncbi:hypothetical protein LJB87_00305 [Alistipes sp. OttesenSCG-928-L06]|nr:hypothetical protein [Alistipes sp. OttesenSCG-928-L06]